MFAILKVKLFLDTEDKIASGESDEDESFALDNSEIVKRLKMCSKQRKLYDDYLADPKTR